MTWTAKQGAGLILILGVLGMGLALALDGGSAADEGQPPELPGRWAVDVLRTVAAAEAVAGEPVREAWITDLNPRTHWLQLGEDGAFELHLGEGATELSITGSWVAVEPGLAITPAAINGQALAAETRKTDTVRRDGKHLIVSQGTYGLYLHRPAP